MGTWSGRNTVNTSWGSRTDKGYLLNEDSTYILNEDGSKISLEDAYNIDTIWSGRPIIT